MNKQLRKNSARKKKTLFARIMTGVTLPMLFLILVFTAIQLANEIGSLNKVFKLRSRFALETIQKTLSLTLASHAGKAETTALTAAVRELERIHNDSQITLFDLLKHETIVNQAKAWDANDKKLMEHSLNDFQQKKLPYLVKVNKERQLFSAYIPIANTSGSLLYVAKVTIPLINMQQALSNSRMSLLLMIIVIIFTGLTISFRLSRSIVKPILTLNEATEEIVKGKLGKHVHIKTGDEIENLANTFNHMSDALEQMKQEATDANPLSGLPGNQGIFKNLKKRIHEKQKFVLFHTDLDRFKVFNDHYGLAKGDEAIVATAKLLKEAKEKIGSEDDFVGHQGGDDFVVITRPQKAKELAEWITKEFDDRVVKSLYAREDIERGYILQLDRRRLAETGEEVMTEFPLLALSLAGVSSAKKDFADYFDCMSSAVSVKKEVKAVIESSYLIKE